MDLWMASSSSSSSYFSTRLFDTAFQNVVHARVPGWLSLRVIMDHGTGRTESPGRLVVLGEAGPEICAGRVQVESVQTILQNCRMTQKEPAWLPSLMQPHNPRVAVLGSLFSISKIQGCFADVEHALLS